MPNIFERFDIMPHSRTEAVAVAQAEGFELRCFIRDDDTADTSYLGEFSNTCARPATFSFEHEPNNHRSYNWFNAENVETREQAKENYDRAQGFGESWCMYGVEVRVYKNRALREGDKEYIRIASASLWGIESDSDESYFLEVANDLAAEAMIEAKETLARWNAPMSEEMRAES